MAENKKITELTELTSAATDDVIAIVDISADETKKITTTNYATAISSQIDLSGYVPYDGATDDLDMGANGLLLTGNVGASDSRIGTVYGTVFDLSGNCQSLKLLATATSNQLYLGAAPDNGIISYDYATDIWSFLQFSVPSNYYDSNISVNDIYVKGNLYGGTDSGGDLNIYSTSHATKGKILFGNSAYDEVNNRLGIGTATPEKPLDIRSDSGMYLGVSKQFYLWTAATTVVMEAPVTNSDYLLRIYPGGVQTMALRIKGSNGCFGFGVNSPVFKLDAQINSVSLLRMMNVGASSSVMGAGIQAGHNDGAAMASGDRLAFYTFGGFNGSVVANSSAISSFATSGWSGSQNDSDLRFETTETLGRTVKMTILGNGNTGIGIATPTAVLHLKAGTATASTAPLKFTSGTLLTTPESGTIEYNNTPHFTNSDATRRNIVLSDGTYTAGLTVVGGKVKINIGGTDYNVLVE